MLGHLGRCSGLAVAADVAVVPANAAAVQAFHYAGCEHAALGWAAMLQGLHSSDGS